ncbi:hypothetical protein [Prevotella sp. HUN102]|uniref:hypothetical protein n=1 Tax=Prevotella sp. HUN102 TaxID=1392486 RepID=UPI00048E3562|nr:hypothetical protein [Prevotella sp. HUN102]
MDEQIHEDEHPIWDALLIVDIFTALGIDISRYIRNWTVVQVFLVILMLVLVSLASVALYDAYKSIAAKKRLRAKRMRTVLGSFLGAIFLVYLIARSMIDGQVFWPSLDILTYR